LSSLRARARMFLPGSIIISSSFFSSLVAAAADCSIWEGFSYLVVSSTRRFSHWLFFSPSSPLPVPFPIRPFSVCIVFHSFFPRPVEWSDQ
ncbi:hypothetical protein PMAYCL1PPCAC_14537, partial [Pristionchus mayeri]